MASVRQLKARRKVAEADYQAHRHLLDEAFEYAIPYRRSTRETGKGEKRVNRVFDHTAIVSAFRFAGKLQQDLAPPGQEFFVLEPGAVFKAAAQGANGTAAVDQLRMQLEGVSSIVQALFLDGEWDQALHEMALDLSAGTGAMVILEGDDRHPARFVAVPVDEVRLEGDGYGNVTGRFWGPRKWSLRAIVETWPEAHEKFDAELAQQLRDKPETEVDLNQDTVWDAKKKRWALTVWIDKKDLVIHRAESRSSPWITPRYFRVAGETWGRGPVMLAMPTIKTLNKAQQFTLQAAAIAMLGIYTAVDDGVFNPDLAAIAPGTFWKVARNGGTLGPSVSRFPDPRLDLSNIVLNELKMGVQAAMMDQSLPADGAAVRSATEILERVKRLASDHLGAFGRLVREIIVPSVERVIEIAYNKQLIPQPIPLDELLIKVRVMSPLATAREAQRVQKIVEWLQMVLALAPQQADEVAKVPEALADVGHALTVSPRYILTDEERGAVRKAKADAAQAMQAMQLAALGGKAAADFGKAEAAGRAAPA